MVAGVEGVSVGEHQDPPRAHQDAAAARLIRARNSSTMPTSRGPGTS